MMKSLLQIVSHQISRQKNRLRNFFHQRAVILLYHRINEFKSDPQLMCTSPANFEKHLRIIQEHYHPLSLTQLGRGIQNNNLPRN